MAIIYEKEKDGLITASGRQFSQYPSGLIRVEQRFTCTQAMADFWRLQLKTGELFPGIAPRGGMLDPDTAGPGGAVSDYYIFPEPQETTRMDGFTDFVVSAYSRTIKGRDGVEMFISSEDFGVLTNIEGVAESTEIIEGQLRISGFGYWVEYVKFVITPHA